MNDQTPSGSRWEPAETTGAVPPQPPAPETTGDVAPLSAGSEARGTGRLAWLRRNLRTPGGRSWKVVVATLLLLGGGTGGYAVGHATADDARPGYGRMRGFDGPAPGGDPRFGDHQGGFAGPNGGGAPAQPGSSDEVVG